MYILTCFSCFCRKTRGNLIFLFEIKFNAIIILQCTVCYFKSLAMHGSHCVPKFNRIRKSGITWACCFVLSAFITL